MWSIMKYLPALVVILVCSASIQAAPIAIANNSFEIPPIDPITNPFLAIPFVPLWIEKDLDPEYSLNTGIFRNTPPDSPDGDHIVNADGNQLVFLSSQQGNGISQDLSEPFKIGQYYKMTVGLCVSKRFPPAPTDTLTLAIYYLQGSNRVDIATKAVPAAGLTATQLQNFTVALPIVQPKNAWTNKPIGVAIRATGAAGGFWDIDNVRLEEILPTPDFNGDGLVNLADFNTLSAQWLSSGIQSADFNGDQRVTIPDLILWIESWLQHVSN